MTLQEAEFIANEFNKLTSVQSAEVVPNVDGDYSVLITRTDGRRAVSCDLDTADWVLTVVKIEENYAHAVYATLGEGNVPVFCSRETWKAWWEANPGGKVVKSEQSGGFVTAITFTGFSSERDGPLKFWTVDADWHMLLARKLHYPRRSGCVSRIDQRTKLGVVPVG